MTRVTIAQIAAEVGVSAMTVSNVLNGRPGASAATRQLVQSTAERLGYISNNAARHLRSGTSGLMGLVTLDMTAQYTLEIVRGVAEELAEEELELLVRASYHDAGREQEAVQSLSRFGVDGILLIAPVLEGGTSTALQRSGRPCVIIDPRRLDVDLPRVTVDNYGGMRAGVEHLLQLGHTRIAYVRGDAELESTDVRMAGFTDALTLAGVPVEPGLVTSSSFTYENGFHVGEQLLARPDRPTAVVAGGDLIALGVAGAAQALGLQVPQDVSVLGFDDLPQASQRYPGLTTVRQPLHEMGRQAARTLLGLVAGQELIVKNQTLATALVVRGTTGPPSTTSRQSVSAVTHST